MPTELAGLCALLGNQQSHNVPLTNLQVVELQRAMAVQKLATGQQEAAAVQARIDEKVAEELKKVTPGHLPVQPVAGPSEKKKIWGRRLVVISVWIISRRARGGGQSMLSEPMTSLPTKKRTRSSKALQRDRQSVVLELRYGRHETGLNHATSWYRTLWQDSSPHETHRIKMYRPILKDMGAAVRRRLCL